MKTTYPVLLFLLVLTSFSTHLSAQPGDCLASFVVDTSGCPTLTFVDQSTSGSSPIVSWTWTFGDGGFAAGQTPSHTYAAGGRYLVCHNIYAQNLCTSSFCDSITVSCLAMDVEGPASDEMIRLRSNPVTEDRLQLVLPAKMAGTLTVELFAVSGTLLRKWENACVAGDCELDFSMEKGVYILRIMGKNGLGQTLRVVKL